MARRTTPAAALFMLAALPALAAPPAAPSGAPAPRGAAPAARPVASGQPPHAWLFGSWTGGLFPAPEGINTQTCLSQPVVIFTQDVVMRAVLTDQFYDQRLIETARVTQDRIEFRFVAPLAPVLPGDSGLLGLDSSAPAGTAAGFSCENPNVLHVQRLNDNEISFPGCADFPYPLVRCAAH